MFPTKLFPLLACLIPASLPAQTNSLLTETAARSRAAGTLSGTITLTRQSGKGPQLRVTGTFVLRHPNFASIKLSGNDPDVPLEVASDGKDIYTVTDPNTYGRASIDSRGNGIASPWWALPIRFFFTQTINPFAGASIDTSAKVTELPSQTIEGHAFRVLQVDGNQPMGYRETFYIGPSGFVERSRVDFGDPAQGGASFAAELSNLKQNPPTALSAFSFKPPTSAKLKEGTLADTMLPLGDTAPDFSLPSKDGPRLSLTGLRRGAKATLVNFWFLDCPPCRLEFPDFETLYTQFHSQGLQVVAIDRGDPARGVNDYVKKTGLTFPIALGGAVTQTSVFAKFRVEDIFPGTYLLDEQGKVVYRAAGQDTKGLQEALTRLGFH